MTVPMEQFDDTGERPNGVAMQPRCPTCLTEQCIFRVYEFSHGELPCGDCKEHTHPMTFEQYHAALRDTRDQPRDLS